MNIPNSPTAIRLAPLFLLGALALAVPAVQAQVAVSVTATAVNTNLGYTLGQTYTFTYLVAGNFSSNASSYFDGTNNIWREYNVAHDLLFTGVTGDGLAGTYVRPILDLTDPHSLIEMRPNVATPGSDHLEMSVSSQLGDIGLTADGEAVRTVYMQLRSSGANFLYSGYDQPSTVLLASAGTYSPNTGDTHGLTVYSLSSGYADFSVTSFTISAIPEPSTYAALAGLGALGFAVWRRANRLRARAGEVAP